MGLEARGRGRAGGDGDPEAPAFGGGGLLEGGGGAFGVVAIRREIAPDRVVDEGRVADGAGEGGGVPGRRDAF